MLERWALPGHKSAIAPATACHVLRLWAFPLQPVNGALDLQPFPGRACGDDNGQEERHHQDNGSIGLGARRVEQSQERKRLAEHTRHQSEVCNRGKKLGRGTVTPSPGVPMRSL